MVNNVYLAWQIMSFKMAAIHNNNAVEFVTVQTAFYHPLTK